MRARSVLILAVVVGIAIVTASWLWWILTPRESAAPPLPLPEIPAPPEEPSPPEPKLSVPIPLPSPDGPRVGILDRGTLVVEARGQRISTEEYTLERRDSGELVLHSQGTLSFKIALFTVQATFAQVITFSAQRRPLSYQFALQGPAGIGNRAVSARFGPTTAIVDDGQKKTEIALPQESFLLLGMFSSYAILPLWAKRDAAQKLKVISLRGDRRDREISVLLEYMGPAQLSDGSSTLEADEYLLKDEQFTLKVYLSEDRFLALKNDTTERDRSFRLYRSDLFPQGLKP